ncbi:MAG: hypothetical protein FWD33_00430 [Alphaproteobacteria bacterium]|nr:hypothetical protein [Alphaproteobacteria bacterium]
MSDFTPDQVTGMKAELVQGFMDKNILRIAAAEEELAPENGPGWFRLKNKSLSPLFWSIQTLHSYPRLFELMIILMSEKINEAGIRYDHIMGVPEGGKCLAAALGFYRDESIIYMRKEPKDHGQGGLLIGDYKEGDKVLAVEDVITSGGSVDRDASDKLIQGTSGQLEVTSAIVGLDRQQKGAGEDPTQNGAAYLASKGIELLSVFTQAEAIKYWEPKTDHHKAMKPIIEAYLAKTIVS